ncbi:MAG: molecular chaperone DnaK [Desulfotalea sp.]|nr:MAG: molecular chaperone DnaK [Desulfotalea sp.]
MNQKDLNFFQKLLLGKQQELDSRGISTQESTKAVNLDQSTIGRLSRMDAMQSQAMALETKRRREIEGIRVEAALERIEEEEYGYCASCEETINRRRLEIDPANPFCVTCAAKM